MPCKRRSSPAALSRWLRISREAAEAEVSAAALRVLWAMCLACDAACLPFGMVGELRRKLSPIALAVLLLFMGVGIMNIRVSAEFPCLRQRAAFRRRRAARRAEHGASMLDVGVAAPAPRMPLRGVTWNSWT